FDVSIACNDWSLVAIFHVSSFGGGSSYWIVVRVAEKSGNWRIVLVQYSTMRESICCRTTGYGGAVVGISAGGRARKADPSATANSAARDLSPGRRPFHDDSLVLLIRSVNSTPKSSWATSLSFLPWWSASSSSSSCATETRLASE